ncbi:uncharacterized protein [Temnothorax nylanderi]|uniref:uncharacterized protein isoform X4 n=1 Tax=Temnothorax nylanderi TaxID=102681 RepID=UPI003A8A7F1D
MHGSRLSQISRINIGVDQNQATRHRKYRRTYDVIYNSAVAHRIAHSAAELRILDSGAGLGLDEKDFRRDFLCTSSVSHPRQPASPQPPLPL